MEMPLGTALSLIGIAMVVLVVVLAAMAGLIYFLTGVIKGDEEAEETGNVPQAKAVDLEEVDERETKKVVALIAVALARAGQSRHTGNAGRSSEIGSWRQFHLARRLNQTLRMRRSP